MPTKIQVSCPTCNKSIGLTQNEPQYFQQDYDQMIELFGVSRKGKPLKMCKECFNNNKEYVEPEIERVMEISCMFCGKNVDNLIDARREFGFVKGELRPRESCRTCRNTGDINDSIYDIKDDVIIDEYDNQTRRNSPVVVTGNTAEYHEAFKEIGGVFVRDLMDRDDSGWVFPAKKKGALITLLQKEKKTKKIENTSSGCNECGGRQDDYGAYFICKNCGHLEYKAV